MKRQHRPEAIDTRLVLRVYAWITITAGLLVYAWPAALLPDAQFPIATPPAPWAFTRVAAGLVVASGCCATGLAGLREPVGRRRALFAFALSHLAFGLLFFLQWFAILERVLPPLVGWTPLLIGGVLLYVAVTGPSGTPFRRLMVLGRHDDPTERRRVMMDVRSVAMDDLRSQYEEHIEHAARQEERTRLARDLHDAVKQQLFVVQTAAATVETRFEADPAGARGALEQVRTAAREAMTEMEAMIDQLQSTPVENTGLVDALKRQGEALGFRTGADVKLEIGDLPDNGLLPPGTQQALFRGAQEALANIGRHARASHVTISLGTMGHALELTIKDDGVGFDPLASRTGMGVQNMTARAGVLGASFMLTSAPGGGTLVRFSVPCTARPSRTYGIKALRWAAVLLLTIWYLVVRGVSPHPWILGIAVIAGIATGRYVMAYFTVLRSREATS
jgi:signal transduction histidine kinase